jgi:hypothetical protein
MDGDDAPRLEAGPQVLRVLGSPAEVAEIERRRAGRRQRAVLSMRWDRLKRRS